MALTRAEKQTELAALETELRAAQSAILVDFKGLNVPQVTELRRQVRAAKGRYRVVKNTLVKRALKGTAFEPLGDSAWARPRWPTPAATRWCWRRCSRRSSRPRRR